jgi:molybdate transport system substrate-binding protein
MERLLKITSGLLIATFLCATLGCTSQKKSNTVTLNISAAASLKNSMDEVKKVYETQKTNVKLTIKYSSSGTLQQQIE